MFRVKEDATVCFKLGWTKLYTLHHYHTIYISVSNKAMLWFVVYMHNNATYLYTCTACHTLMYNFLLWG